MNNENNLILNELWKDEIKSYLPRLESLLSLDTIYLNTIKDLWPDKVWPSVDRKVDNQGMVAFRIAVFANSILSFSIKVTNLIVELWRRGDFFLVPLNTRFIYESWGAVHYAGNIFKISDIKKAQSFTSKLLTGVKKAEVYLPDGTKATEEALNVMDYIRALKEVKSDAESIYHFLSSASHPNTIQNEYFLIMGPPISNWGNPLFKKHAHKLLDDVLKAHEQSYRSMQLKVVDILNQSAVILRI